MQSPRIQIFLAIALVLLVALSVLVGCGDDGRKDEEKSDTTSTLNKEEKQEPTDNGKFGFLAAPMYDPFSAELVTALKEIGIGWLRPHPGPFVWNLMQNSGQGPIDFSTTDQLVSRVQAADFDLLVTLWPFAEWDQISRPDASSYQVSEDDLFYPILPLHRGNPADWEAYKQWLAAVVERYDGDGRDDMNGLRHPVRYWEICNEPEVSLTSFTDLIFYKGGPEDYAELLKESYEAIKDADSEAQVLIAGAAGSALPVLHFWDDVFAIDGIRDSFDIANVHCISDGHPEDFNVSRYKDLLESFGLNKPIWVTEAEYVVGSDVDANATRLESSVGAALEAGADKIFFTGASMSGDGYSPQSVIEQKDIYNDIVETYDSGS